MLTLDLTFDLEVMIDLFMQFSLDKGIFHSQDWSECENPILAKILLHKFENPSRLEIFVKFPYKIRLRLVGMLNASFHLKF